MSTKNDASQRVMPLMESVKQHRIAKNKVESIEEGDGGGVLPK